MTEKFELGRLKKKRVGQICCRRLSGFTKHIKVLRDLVELLLEREKKELWKLLFVTHRAGGTDGLMVNFKSTIGNSVKVLILLNVDSSSLVYAVLKEEIACLGCS